MRSDLRARLMRTFCPVGDALLGELYNDSPHLARQAAAVRDEQAVGAWLAAPMALCCRHCGIQRAADNPASLRIAQADSSNLVRCM